MKQSRLASLFETIGGTLLGFLVSLGIQSAICHLYHLPLTLFDNLGIIGIFTLASLVRGYLWRRAFEALHPRRVLSSFVQAVVAERFRQIEQEGWSARHDSLHLPGELAQAGAAYALTQSAPQVWFTLPREGSWAPQPGLPSTQSVSRIIKPTDVWPWSRRWWKPTDPRRDLVKACALIIAEGEKLDCNRKRK